MTRGRSQEQPARASRGPRARGEWLAAGVLAVAALWIGVATLRPFVVPLLWAAIIGYATWPAFALLERNLPGRILPALFATVGVALVIAAPAVWFSFALRDELVGATERFQSGNPMDLGHQLVEHLDALPWLGDALAEAARRLLGRPEQVLAAIGQWLPTQTGTIAAFAGGVGQDLIKIGIAFFALFFVYRDGDGWYEDVRTALDRLFGPRAEHYLGIGQATIRAVVYGLVLAAVAQGAAAGLGYWLVGVSAPALLGTLTALAALVPYGATIIWLPISAWLALVDGEPWLGLALAAWGAVVVGSADNLVRPIVLSTAARIHILPATLGVLGGLAAFGLVGIFIGPMVLVVLLAIWRAWIGNARNHRQAPDR